ncbi:hypothetical protein DRI50_02095 [candidate division KSB1 bacterium]|nr:MAG: hypothetical protein DRI50_02095 [candidate division KSB1 bacterium]
MQSFIRKIYSFEKKYLGLQAVASAVRFVVALLVLWLSVTLADSVFYFSEITRWGLWIFNLALIIYLFARLLLKPLRAYWRFSRNSDLTGAARRISQLFPEVGDDLINGYQLLKDFEEGAESQELKQAAIRHIVQKYEQKNFSERIKLSNMLPEWRWFLFVVAGSALVFALRAPQILHATLRMFNPANPYLSVPAFHFTVTPGDTTIVKGDVFHVKVYYSGPALKSCYLLLKDPHQHKVRKINFNLKNGVYTLTLKNVLQPFTYQVGGQPLSVGELEKYLQSQTYRVRVITLPMVRTLDVTVLPPAYTHLPAEKLERNIGDISALKGSRIEVRLAANKPLNSGQIIFSYGDTLFLKVRQNIAVGRFTLNKEGTYFFSLRDTANWQNRNPIIYQLAILKDYPPLIEIVQPGSDVELPLDARLPLSMEARDDFGINSLKLRYQIVKPKLNADSAWKTISVPLPEKDKRLQTATYVFDFNTLPLAFGDQLKYYALAFDNNYVSGPGIGKSQVYFVRFPSIEEIFKSTDEKQQEKVDDLKDVTDQARDLNKTLRQLDRELKQSRKLDWDKKNQITEAVHRQKELQKKVEQIRKELKDVVQKLEQNDLISEEVLKKYQQLQDLLQDVITPELQKALEKLQKKMEQAAKPKDVEKALKDFRLNQEAFEKRIERTMELLKQVQFEQKMDELVKKAQSLLKQQKKISERLKKSDSLSANEQADLQQMQKEQKEMLNRLQFDLQQMEKHPFMARYPKVAQKLDSVWQQMNKAQLQKQMEQLQQQMNQGTFQQAARQSDKVQQQLAQTAQSLQQAYRQMLNQGKQQVAQKMQRALQRLLQLSQQQENIYKKTNRTSPLSEKFNQVIRDQGELNSNLNKLIGELVQLSKETFLIQPQMSQSMQDAANNMNRALQQLSERMKGSGMRYQKKAMAALNRGVGQMMQSAQQLANAKSGTGFEQFMQQLQQIAGKQGQLNKQTMNLFNAGNGGSLSLQQQREMRRIAAEQAALKQALQKLNEKMGRRENMLGRLGKVAQDMDEVVKDLLKNNLNRKTIERQQRILSRMLDAQKSIREREYSKKRQAVRAGHYLAKNPGKIKNPYDMSIKELQDALRQALQQGYNRDYQRLIEAYFKRLIQDYQKKEQK